MGVLVMARKRYTETATIADETKWHPDWKKSRRKRHNFASSSTCMCSYIMSHAVVYIDKHGNEHQSNILIILLGLVMHCNSIIHVENMLTMSMIIKLV